jgi:predicted nucleic acid-binding protein
MTDRVFLDTNILVYVYDSFDQTKQDRAIAVVDVLIQKSLAAISPQVMGEFYHATTRPKRPLLSPDEALTRIQTYLAVCHVLDITELIVLDAIRRVKTYQFSYWDAQIWATARLHQVVTIYSEDFNSGATIEGVSFINPFQSDLAI